MLTRATIATEPPERRSLAPSVRELAEVLNDLAKELGGRAHVRTDGRRRYYGVCRHRSRTSRGRITRTERRTPRSPLAADSADTVHLQPTTSTPMTVFT